MQRMHNSSNRVITFMRHARTQFNDGCEHFRNHKHIPYDWKKLMDHADFKTAVSFHPQYLDVKLSKVGIQQCQQARETLGKEPVDIIFVSPHIRAFQTCRLVFGQKKQAPIKAVPILNGQMWSICDLSYSSFQEKQKQFPEVDFSMCKQMGQLWFLDNFSEDQRNICLEVFEASSAKTIQQKKDIVISLLHQGRILQKSTMMRRRADEFKMMIKNLDKKYQNIVVVSHYYTVQYLTAKSFTSEDLPVEDINIENCTPYRVTQAQLLQNLESI